MPSTLRSVTAADLPRLPGSGHPPIPDTRLRRLSFRVAGLPRPQGSVRAFATGKGRGAIVTADNPRLRDWRALVSLAAAEAMRGQPPFRGPLGLGARFYLPRPQRAKGETWPSVRPDLDKLARSLLDSLTAIVWTDDAQVARLAVEKLYADGWTGVEVTVSEGGSWPSEAGRLIR